MTHDDVSFDGHSNDKPNCVVTDGVQRRRRQLARPLRQRLHVQPPRLQTVTPQPRCFLFQLFIIYSKHDAFDSREYYVTGPAPRNSLLWDLWDLQSGASLPI